MCERGVRGVCENLLSPQYSSSLSDVVFEVSSHQRQTEHSNIYTLSS